MINKKSIYTIVLTLVGCHLITDIGSTAEITTSESRANTGNDLSAIEVPIGGIGTGCFFMNGKGQRCMWTLWGFPDCSPVPKNVENSFFAIRVRQESGRAVVRALQTEPIGPFPAVERLKFWNEYPYASYDFHDDQLPVSVNLKVYNPLIPIETKDSSIPCGIFEITVRNKGKRQVHVNLIATQRNAVSTDSYGGNRNRIIRDKDGTFIHMTKDSDKKSKHLGDMLFLTTETSTSALCSWPSLESLFKDFSEDGMCTGTETNTVSAEGANLDAAITIDLSIPTGLTKKVTFLLAWHFPQRQSRWAGPDGNRLGPYYANHWNDALDVGRYCLNHLVRLSNSTKLYRQTLYESNLPKFVLDRLSSQVAILRSPTCFWNKDGYFGGFEGWRPGANFIEGNCLHVWGFAQLHAFLYPEVARYLRRADFLWQSSEGKFRMRHASETHANTDGQLCGILACYREHRMTADNEWLIVHWPKIRQAMNWTMAFWDSDGDGIFSGQQWNTMDHAITGSNTWMGSLYLASLRACERMAVIVGDNDAAEKYRSAASSGSLKQDASLFTGKYYIRRDDQGTVCEGCHSLQLMGQWWADELGLGLLYPQEHVRSALMSVYRHNFKPSLKGIRQERRYAMDHHAGLFNETFPNGGKTSIQYAAQIWTGVEYVMASLLIRHGMVEEGLEIVKAVHDRYDGTLFEAQYSPAGNPCGDVEWGRFYARALSVGAVLHALQGFAYDCPRGVISFSPKWKPDDHKSFFTTGNAWGLFEHRRDDTLHTTNLRIVWGTLDLKELHIGSPSLAATSNLSVKMTRNNHLVNIESKADSQGLKIVFASKTNLQAGDEIIVHCSSGKREIK